ncbi:PGH1 synthase, partial [Leiothrix lutea]|nr:PGH1 synthase [Leiothrix lutea]
QGVCVRVGLRGYECDCTRTGYYGVNCTSPEFWTRLHNLLKPSPAFYHFILTHFKWFWDIINSTFIRDTLMRLVLTVRANLIPSPPTFNSDYGYISWEAYANVSYYTRVLPPVPDDCPTPMGTKGKLQLPDPQLLAERFLLRHKFEADPRGTNMMFAFFAQHFTHQFFKTSGKMGRGFTKALGHGVDLGHLYGDNLQRQHQLRLFRDGKLKFQVVNGEVYPPMVTEAPVHMVYPSGVPREQQLAVGQEVFGLLPGLCVYATLWLRELGHTVTPTLPRAAPDGHIRSPPHQHRGEAGPGSPRCLPSVLCSKHSGDARNLWEPGSPARQCSSVWRCSLLPSHGCFLPSDCSSIPDPLCLCQAAELRLSLRPFGHLGSPSEPEFSLILPGHWIGGGQTINANVLHVAVGVIKESRQLRLQPFNEYRKRFGMKPYKSFQELTGEEEKAAELEELYGDIDALEFYPGLLLEKPQPNGIFGESMVEIGAPFSLKGLFGNPICSPEYWKPSTFGGATGFEIVKTASLEKLVCLNVRKCPYVAFHVPDAAERGSPRAGGPSTEL